METEHVGDQEVSSFQGCRESSQSHEVGLTELVGDCETGSVTSKRWQTGDEIVCDV